MAFIWPTEEQWSVLNNRADDQPLTMLNLLRYRETADYSEHSTETPCSGKRAYQRYAEAVFPLLEKVSARVVFMGAAGDTVIGPSAERWDDVLLVEYPNRQAFNDMSSSTAYQAIAYHRAAALSDSRLVPLAAGKAAFQN